jgi:2,4-dienoyl-CoA reductase-like NADH-dependent reductase (Old Yellow Enzyme family)
MSKLFESLKINKMELKNRFLMSAAHDNLVDNEKARIKRYEKLAVGNIGLIISGGTRPHKIKSWDSVVRSVKQKGGKMAIQLVMTSGPVVDTFVPDPNSDRIAVSQLDVDHAYFKATGYKCGNHHTMSEEEIKDLIKAYAKAAKEVKELGADAVQIHAAHQNFLSQFLSPLTNLRKDDWGGSVENRCRIHREIIKAIRAEVGEEFPILIKLGIEDAIPGGLIAKEGIEVAKLIAQTECDALEISQGLMHLATGLEGTPMHPKIRKQEQEAYFRKWSAEIKKEVKKPIILTGGIRSLSVMEELIENQEADMIGMCRPFVCEPDLVNLLQNGTRDKSSCSSCNKCITEDFAKGGALRCFVNKESSSFLR